MNFPGATLPSLKINPEETDWPSTGTSFNPIIVNIVASVASKSGIFKTTIKKALNSPTSTPPSSTTTRAIAPVCA